MNIRSKLLLFLILIALPLAGRWAWFYRGSSYQAPAIPEIDDSRVIPPVPVYQPFEDKPLVGNGRVVIDLSHTNNLKINDLAPLQDRLEVRGVTVETIDGSGDSLETYLHNATALIIIAPTEKYTPPERDAVVGFVEDGGRLLLAADPTRPVPLEGDENFDLFAALFPTSAVPAINSLANAFGIIYFDDYLYNLEDNEGNYRNVKFTNFNNEHPLTQDLKTVVFFASHSLRSDGLSLITGDKQTHSPVRSGETDLAVVTLTADGRALALGDVTFLTAPFHTIGDNDIFLSRIADWLAVDERIRDDLEDFPYLFEQPVDLVQVSGDFLDPRLIVHSGALEEIFDQAGLTLSLSAVADPNHDALLVGAFDDLDLVQDYLSTAGITITLAITAEEEAELVETEAITAEEEAAESDETAIEIETPEEATEDTQTEIAPQITPSSGLTPTEEIETGEEETDGEGFLLEVEAGDAKEGAEAEEEAEPKFNIKVETLGTIGATGITLFIVDRSSDRTTVIALAEDGDTGIEALERLVAHDLSGCVQSETVTICSTGEVQDRFKPDTADESAKEDGSQGDIFILSKDDGAEGTRTGAAEFEDILGNTYDITVWSVESDGVPTSSDLAGYRAYIFDSGDYAFDLEDTDAFFSILDGVEGGRLMLIGAQSLPSFEAEYEPINDLKVADTTHPLADGFTSNEVISLSESESGVPAVVIVDDELLGSADESEVIFTRGPDSPEAGTPALIAASDGHGGLERFIIAPFAFYRLPKAAQRTFALNAAKWLTEP